MLLCDTALYILSLHCIPQHWMQPPGNHSCYLDDEDKMDKTEGNRKMGEPQTAKQTQKKVLLGQHKISFSGTVPLLSKLWSAAYLMRQKEKGEARHVCLCQPSITDKKRGSSISCTGLSLIQQAQFDKTCFQSKWEELQSFERNQRKTDWLRLLKIF